jgi:hypothetical protein
VVHGVCILATGSVSVKKLTSLTVLVLGVVATASAAVPEIDPGSSVQALALLSGAVLVVRSIRRK